MVFRSFQFIISIEVRDEILGQFWFENRTFQSERIEMLRNRYKGRIHSVYNVWLHCLHGGQILFTSIFDGGCIGNDITRYLLEKGFCRL